MKVACLGIDPGLSGGIALINEFGNVEFVGEMPVVQTKAKKIETALDLEKLNRIFQNLVELTLPRPVIWLEQIHSLGANEKMGKVQTAHFFKDWGTVYGLAFASGLPVRLVVPQKWQRALGKKNLGDKPESIVKALELYPQYKKHLLTKGGGIYHDGKVEALLIAHYGQMELAKTNKGKG